MGEPVTGFGAHKVTSTELRERFDDILVGREFIFLDNQCRRSRNRPGRGCKFEQVDRNAVSDDDFTLARADQAGERCADRARQVKPAGRIPRLDQFIAPVAGRRPLQLIERRMRCRPQGMANKVGLAVLRMAAVLTQLLSA